jgi:hypothetical protein
MCKQNRLDVLSRREAWMEIRVDPDPARLVFIHETIDLDQDGATGGRGPRARGCGLGPARALEDDQLRGGNCGPRRSRPFPPPRPIDRDAFRPISTKYSGRNSGPETWDDEQSGQPQGPAVLHLIEAGSASLLYLPILKPPPSTTVESASPSKITFL